MEIIGFSNYSFLPATDRSWKSQKAALLELGFEKESLPKGGLRKPNSKRKLAKIIKPRSEIARNLKTDPKVGLAQVAVTLSHMRAWKDIANFETGLFLIMEDDACVTTTFPHSSFRSLMTQALKKFPRKQMYLLGYCFPYSTRRVLRTRFNSLETGRYQCMHSYLITPVMARFLLSQIFPIRIAVDAAVFEDAKIMRRALAFTKPLFTQSGETARKSDINSNPNVEEEAEAWEEFGKCIDA